MRNKKLHSFPKGGIHPAENKLSKGKRIEPLPLPEMVSIPVAQHIGAPTKIIVKRGDEVKVGQVIAEAGGYVSANIHSSVSGKVKKIDYNFDSSGYKQSLIIIDVVGDDWLPDIDRTEVLKMEIRLSSEEIVKKISEMGIVGLGGATFPTHVKLSIPKGKKAEYIILNAAECEPYLTADHQIMMDKGPEIIIGIKLLMKAIKVEKAIIGIENNKEDAIKRLQELVLGEDGIEVKILKVQYPQGGEKQLIKAVLGREVPSGGLPIDVGCVVQNVGTAFAVYEAVQKNKPLIERVVTLTGKGVKSPANFMVRIGTSVREVIDAGGGLPEKTGKVINGGPMMGKALSRLDVPITKGSSGILILQEDESIRLPKEACIRCAKCVSVCPMGLEPYLLMTLSERAKYEREEQERVLDCIECGSCSYVCPSHRPLLDYIRLGKVEVMKIVRARN